MAKPTTVITTIHATALAAIQLAARGQMKAPEWTLFHGVVGVRPAKLQWHRIKYKGKWQRIPLGIPHALLEHGNTVYDAVEDRFYTKREYRDKQGTRELFRYTTEAVGSLMLKHKVYGPFNAVFEPYHYPVKTRS